MFDGFSEVQVFVHKTSFLSIFQAHLTSHDKSSRTCLIVTIQAWIDYVYADLGYPDRMSPSFHRRAYTSSLPRNTLWNGVLIHQGRRFNGFGWGRLCRQLRNRDVVNGDKYFPALEARMEQSLYRSRHSTLTAP